MPGVEWVEMHAVVGGHIEAPGGPGIVARADRVDGFPGPAAVECAVGAEQIGRITNVGIAGREAQAPGRVEEDVAATLLRAAFDPGSNHVLRGPVRLGVDDGPGGAAVGSLADAVEDVFEGRSLES